MLYLPNTTFIAATILNLIAYYQVVKADNKLKLTLNETGTSTVQFEFIYFYSCVFFNKSLYRKGQRISLLFSLKCNFRFGFLVCIEKTLLPKHSGNLYRKIVLTGFYFSPFTTQTHIWVNNFDLKSTLLWVACAKNQLMRLKDSTFTSYF